MNPLATKIKICLVTVTLSDGGAERVAAELSKYFDAKGYEVHHVVFSGTIKYDYKGTVHHLINSSKNKIYNKFKRLLKLYYVFKTHNFDFVIDFRNKEIVFQELLINLFIYPKFIQTIHNFHTEYYFFKNSTINNLMYSKCSKFVCVSNKIKEKVIEKYFFTNVELVYNPIQLKKESNAVPNFTFEYIVAAGRMGIDNVKQFDVIIETYAASLLPSQNIKLVILGTGELLENLQQKVKKINMQEWIIFKGFVENPFSYYKGAKFLVMASKFEGFPMVLIECLAEGTPIVSWNFNSGPSEIIDDKINGLLVENNNKLALIEAMNLMVTDKILYLHCKSNAQASVKRFELNEIGKQWEAILNQL